MEVVRKVGGVERFGADQPFLGCPGAFLQNLDSAEATNIVIHEAAAALESKTNAEEPRARGRLRWEEQEFPGHPQVDPKQQFIFVRARCRPAGAVFERDQDVLCPTVHAGDRSTSDRARQLRRGAAYNVGPGDLRVRHDPAHERRSQCPHDGLDLGKLGHDSLIR